MPHYGLEAFCILTNKHKFLNYSLRSVWFSCWEKDRKRVRWHIYCGTKCIAVYNTSSWTHTLPLSSLAADIVLWRSRHCSYFRTNVCINKQTNQQHKSHMLFWILWRWEDSFAPLQKTFLHSLPISNTVKFVDLVCQKSRSLSRSVRNNCQATFPMSTTGAIAKLRWQTNFMGNNKRKAWINVTFL